MSHNLLEHRASLAAVAGVVGVFCGLLLLLPARPAGFDEAKYLGIGLNVLAGDGARTAFGAFFEPHSPLWPIVMAAPQAWFGLDAYAWAHVVNVVAAGSLVVLGARLGWGIRPAAGALAAIGILGSAYLFGLARRTGLDIPAAALSLGYLVAGLAAVRRGSPRLAIVAGAVFAAAFLVKEVVVALAPVPLFVGLAWRRPAAELIRLGAVMLAVVAVGTSWWWLLFAAETGRVYRLGTPAWTLGPIAVAVVAAILVGLAWDRPVLARLRGRIRTPSEPAARTAAWALGVVWALVLGAFFLDLYARGQRGELTWQTWELRSGPLLDSAQLGFYAGRWIEELVPFLVLGGIGTILELGDRRRPSVMGRGPVIHLLLALVCSLPYILLVIGVGEHPRHYVAQLVILSVIGASGWLAILEAAVTRPSRANVGALAIAAAGAVALLGLAFLGRRGPLAIAAVLGVAALTALAVPVIGRVARSRLERSLAGGRLAAVAVGAAFVAASVAVAVIQLGRPVAPIDSARAEVVDQVTAWIRAQVPEGSTVAFNGTISHEAANRVGDRVRPVVVREDENLVFDPAAPLGVRAVGGAPADDWIALMTSPSTGSTFFGYRATELIEILRRESVDAWVVVELTGPDRPLVIDAALTPEHGFRRLLTVNVPYGNEAVEARVYGIDRDRLAFGPELYISTEAMARLLDQLEASDASAVARALLERAVVVSPGPRAEALRQRLTLAAGR